MITNALNRIPLIVALLALTAGPLSAMEADGMDSSRGHHDRSELMAEKLGLSDEQKTQMKKIHEGSKEEREALHKEMKAVYKAMKAAMLDPNTSDSDLRAQRKAMQSMMAKKSDLKFEKMLAVRKILTTEQRAKFLEMKNKRKHKFHMGEKMRNKGCDQQDNDEG